MPIRTSGPGRFARFAAAIGVTVWAAGCASPRALTSVSAGVLAARLANERCQKAYGARPFAPEDFEAVNAGGRWHWGGDEGGLIDGYAADVSFDAGGNDPRVEVRVPPE